MLKLRRERVLKEIERIDDILECKTILDERQLLLEIDHIYRDCHKEKRKTRVVCSLYSFYLTNLEL